MRLLAISFIVPILYKLGRTEQVEPNKVDIDMDRPGSLGGQAYFLALLLEQSWRRIGKSLCSKTMFNATWNVYKIYNINNKTLHVVVCEYRLVNSLYRGRLYNPMESIQRYIAFLKNVINQKMHCSNNYDKHLTWTP